MRAKFVVITKGNLVYETKKLQYLRNGVYVGIDKKSLDNEGRIIGIVRNIFVPYTNIKTIEEVEQQ